MICPKCVTLVKIASAFMPVGGFSLIINLMNIHCEAMGRKSVRSNSDREGPSINIAEKNTRKGKRAMRERDRERQTERERQRETEKEGEGGKQRKQKKEEEEEIDRHRQPREGKK